MENLNDKIVKVELEISDNCPDDKREIINDYWAYNENNYKLNKLPSQIAMKYHITQSELSNMVEIFSDINLFIHCDYCKTVECNNFTSHTTFKNALAQLRRLREDKYKCKKCQAIEEDRSKLKTEAESQEKAEKLYKMAVDKKIQLNKAIDRKKWNTLSEFENVVLKNVILLNDFKELKKYYLNLGIQHYKKMLSALRILEAQNLLILEFDYWDKTKIVKYFILGRLREKYVYQPKLQNIEKAVAETETNFQNNKIALTLSATNNQFHPDCPPSGAIFSVEESVVFKPGVEYSCNLYNEKNGGISIKISEVKIVNELPAQIRLATLPTELRTQVEDFWRNSDNNI